MKKNCVMFFRATAVGVIAVFLFSAASFGAFAVPQAHAYAVGSVSPDAPTPSLNTAAVGNYDVGTSLQSLASPFSAFINSFKWNMGTTTVNTNGVSFAWPTVSVTPVLASTFQNTLSQWFGEFNNWFYGVSGVQLSAISIALLNLFSWVLGLIQQGVNWLVGLFH